MSACVLVMPNWRRATFLLFLTACWLTCCALALVIDWLAASALLSAIPRWIALVLKPTTPLLIAQSVLLCLVFYLAIGMGFLGVYAATTRSLEVWWHTRPGP